jgi:integral membrane protein
MLNLFRLASFAEGISLLIILSVTLGVIPREYVFFLGMTHGVLFLFYFAFAVVVSHKQGWSLITWLLVEAAAFVPFAFIAVEMFLKKEIAKAAAIPHD